MRVEIFNRRILHAVEHILADGIESTIRNLDHEEAVDIGRQSSDQINSAHTQNHLYERSEISCLRILSNQRQNAFVDKRFQKVSSCHTGTGANQHEYYRQSQHPAFMQHIL
ncbi:hypothetical protein SDC9_89457 [bioreactor metagenome]|uniref:Uncharacterized protein n=1 Tax=bioreactor metagenome TaxID=1076179 RepID=A0A644ZPV1_9ZZZZ